MSGNIDTLPRAAGIGLQVTPETRKIPEIVNRLNDWQYLERSVHRKRAA